MTDTQTHLRSDWRELERMGMDAFPAMVEERRMGAVFRAAGGVNYRNSSVTLLDPEAADIDQLLNETKIFSARHGIEPVLRAPRLWPDTERQLTARGWRVFRNSAVFDAAIPHDARTDPALEANIAPDTWLSLQLENRDLEEGARQTLETILSSIPAQAAKLQYRPEGNETPLASALLWFDGTHCALMNMLVAPQARGQGIGRRFLDTMFGYAAGRGATVMWLQVHLENAAALALYKRAGFEKVYDYAYWRPVG